MSWAVFMMIMDVYGYIISTTWASGPKRSSATRHGTRRASLKTTVSRAASNGLFTCRGRRRWWTCTSAGTICSLGDLPYKVKTYSLVLKQYFIKTIYSSSGHPRCRWICFFIITDLDKFSITSLAYGSSDRCHQNERRLGQLQINYCPIYGDLVLFFFSGSITRHDIDSPPVSDRMISIYKYEDIFMPATAYQTFSSPFCLLLIVALTFYLLMGTP